MSAEFPRQVIDRFAEPLRSECARCGAKAQLWLCNHCQDRLRDMLTTLATGTDLGDGRRSIGLIEALHDSATGQAHLDNPTRRTPRYRRHLNGDAELATQIEPYPDDDEANLTKARHDRETAALQHALGAAKINLRAAQLLDYTHSVLIEWCRDICDTRGVETPDFTPKPEPAGRNDPNPPWLDAETIHVAQGDPGPYCEECTARHRGECA